MFNCKTTTTDAATALAAALAVGPGAQAATTQITTCAQVATDERRSRPGSGLSRYLGHRRRRRRSHHRPQRPRPQGRSPGRPRRHLRRLRQRRGLASIKSSTGSGNGVSGIVVSGDAAVLTSNRAEGNGFSGGVSDGNGTGITVDSTTPPVGTNLARGNDYAGECNPSALC
jgi:hypothetical protein